MSKLLYTGFVTLLLLLGTMFAVSAQDVTVEPPIDVTVEVTVDLPGEATPETTSEPGAQPTTAPAGEQPGAEATAEMTVMPGIEATPSDDNGYLRVAHFSADAPAVDVYIDGNLALSDLNFRDATPWMAFAPATYSVSVVPSGSAASETAAAPIDVSVSGGTWQTVAIIGSAENGTLQGIVFSEDYSELLPGTGGFTFFHALEGVSPVNLVRDDVVYYAQISYPADDPTTSSSSLRDDTGVFNVRVVPSDNETSVLVEDAELEIPENGYSLLALVGTPSEPELVEIVTDESEVSMVRGLLPEPGTIVEALNADENLMGFATAIAGSDLINQLSDPDAEYTVFAPASFVMDDGGVSGAALESYIVEGKHTSNDLAEGATFTALDGTPITVTTADDGIYANGVLVIDVNMAATNGVIHMLNGNFESPAS